MRRVGRDFPAGEVAAVLDVLGEVAAAAGTYLGEAHVERVQAAVVLLAAGDSARFLDAAALAHIDWRDVLVAAELADGDWAQRIAEALDS